MRSHRKRFDGSFLCFVAPAFLFYALIVLIPSLGALYFSFTNWNGLNPTYDFVGLSNYLDAFWDENFGKSILFTCKYVLVLVAVQNSLALALALAVEKMGRSKPVFRTIFFAPNVMSAIISSYMFGFIFSKVLPAIGEATGIGFFSLPWIGDPNVSFFSILLVSLWGGAGYMMIIYIAALQGGPQEVLESAELDGATGFQKFRSIIYPMIFHAVTICTFLTLKNGFKSFDLVFGLTGGGPDRATQVVTLNIYEEAYSNYFKYGYADAKSVLFFLLLAIIAVVQVLVMKKKEVQA